MNEPDPAVQPSSRSGRPRRLWWWVLGAFGLLYVVMVAMSAGGVPNGTSVRGVDIGGDSVAEAERVLSEQLGPLAKASIRVNAVDGSSILRPGAVGLRFDAAATAQAAAGPEFNPVVLVQHLLGRVEVEPVVTYNQGRMSDYLDGLAADVLQPPVEPGITVAVRSAQTTPGRSGRALDTEGSTEVILAAYLASRGPIVLPDVELPPAVADAEAEKVRSSFADPAVADYLTVRAGSVQDRLSSREIAEALSFQVQGDTLAPQLDLEAVRAGLPKVAAAERPGADATFDVSSGTPAVVPSRPGRAVADAELRDAVMAVLPDPAPRVAQVELRVTRADLTTKEAEALRVNEQLSSFTQRFPAAQYRRINVGQAAEYLDGTLLKPGQTFSMNDTILERTAANGYVKGTFIAEGGRFAEGLGGGVSIATTATWTAAFFAGLEAVEVNPHSLYISRYQAGLEATVAWNQLDLRFRNDTGNGVLITATAGSDFITVTMWGTKKYTRITDESSPRYGFRDYETVYDSSPLCQPQSGVPGFSIDVDRVFFQGAEEVRREQFHTEYDPTNTVVCGTAAG